LDSNQSFSPGEPLLRVERLKAGYVLDGHCIDVLRSVSFSIEPGEIVGLLGESGSGKSTTALAILGLLPPQATVDGSVRFRGRELVGERETALCSMRGAQISLILQEPALSLNPVIRVRDQVAEVVRAHRNCGSASCRTQAVKALEAVGLNEDRLQKSYPHELSGGQRQRVLLAQATVCRPALIIADEPTGALDAAAQSEILRLLHDMVRQFNCAVLLISHEPFVIESLADRVIVLYGGQIVESGSTGDVLRFPLHPYTKGLTGCRRHPLGHRESNGQRRLPVIAGHPPDFQSMPSGCAFEPRCPERIEICAHTDPPPALVASREVRCFLHVHG
jgi:peptide/nickel transport system ATP-binding protein/oligopeptide transport system ATP-binding protein